MKQLERRISELEAVTGPSGDLRVLWRVIDAQDGVALPSNPTWARPIGREGAELHRRGGESPEAFERRALEHFSESRVVVIGSGDTGGKQ